jgi:anti-anti-sigma regulatory factor
MTTPTPGAEQSVADKEAWPYGRGSAESPAVTNVSLVIGRALGTVVVTVHGALDLAGCKPLEGVLTDLIEGQGNLAVAVDLGRATVEPEAVVVFVTAAHRARRHRARFILKEPPTHTREALESGGAAELVEILPRRASGR